MDKDYSEYKPSKTELYFIQRRGNKYISLNFFDNLARFFPEEKRIHILVDHINEEIFRVEDIEEDERVDREHREIHPDVFSPEDIKERESQRRDGIAENEKEFAALCERFSIDRSIFEERAAYEYEARGIEDPFPLNNVLSGADIYLRYGEGLLDFIYADFDPELQKMTGWVTTWRALANRVKADNPEQVKALLKQAEESGAEKVYCRAQDIVTEYFRFVDTMRYTKPIMLRSLYTMICPPVFTNNQDADKALIRYGNYLRILQDEYREMVEFCLDETFWPEVLGGMHAVDRYTLYRQLKDLPSSFQRIEDWGFDMSRMGGEEPPYGLPVDELKKRFSTPLVMTPAHERFAREYGTDLDTLRGILSLPQFLNVQYEFRSVKDILELEFSKMLEVNMRLSKEKDSGRYVLSE